LVKSGVCHFRALRRSSGGSLALDLRGHVRDLPLFECLRLDHSAFPKTAESKSRGADPDRTTILDRAGSCFLRFSLWWVFRGWKASESRKACGLN